MWLHILLLGGWDMGPFSCDAEPAHGGGFGERLGHLRESLLKRLAVDAGGGDGLPAYPVLPGPQLLHPLGGEMGLDAV